jgi:YD repeat-containing protein
MNCTNVSRRGFFARLTAACGWLTVRTTEPPQRPVDDAALTTSYRYDDLGRLLSVTHERGNRRRTNRMTE